MRMFLNSDGFEEDGIRAEFLKFFGGDVSNEKVLFLHTSGRGFKEEYLVEMREHWSSMGFSLENLRFIDMDKWEVEDLEFDIVCVCGGNTFYILEQMRRLGLDKVVGEAVRGGVVYVGMSAGSIIAGPDIEISGWRNSWDVNDVGMEDFSGLGLTEIIINPHYEDEDEDDLVQFEKERGIKVIRLRDGETLVVDGDEERVIG